MLTAIYCTDKNGVIGFKYMDTQTNDVKFKQPLHSKVDKKFFVTNTRGKIIIMGANTARALLDEGFGLLPNRHHVILTTSEELKDRITEVNKFDRERVSFISNLKELEHYIDDYRHLEMFVIGGSNLIEQLKDRIDSYIVTEFDTIAVNDNPFHKTLEVIKVQPLGSCKTGEIREGFKRVDCTKFTDGKLTGYFGEYQAE